MRRLSCFGLTILAALAVAACGGTTASGAPASGAPAPSAAASAPAGAAVACTKASSADPAVAATIKDFKFSPDPITAKIGEIIAWTNGDGAPHTASLADGSCGTDQIAGGASGALVFSVAGTYTYQCMVHPGQMKDYTITITE
jgi:plastocyanin